MKITLEDKFQWTIRFIAGALVMSLFLGSKIWLTSRDFPVLPYFDFIPSIPPPIDYAIYAITVAVASLLIIYPLQSKLVWATAGLLLFLMLFDQMRWQPNIFFYLMGLGALSLANKNKEFGLQAIRAMLIFWFVWSGIQELNPVFKTSIFPYLFKPIISIFPKAAAPFFQSIAYVFPILQIAVGLLLLINHKLIKNYVVYSAAAIHFILFLVMSPLGNGINYSYLPYHVSCVGLILFLFLDHKIDIKTLFYNRSFLFSIPVTLFMGIMPIFNFVGLWDSLQSYHAFSGKVKYGKVYMPEDMTEKLPDSIKNQIKRFGDEPYVEITLWSLEVLDVPAYAEERVYNQIKDYICEFDTASTCRAKLEIYTY